MQSQNDVVIVGGGLAGIVTALECLRAGQSVALVDRDSPERLGGLALWAFGGMAWRARRCRRAWRSRHARTGAARLAALWRTRPGGHLPQQWARYYVEHSRGEVYDWLLREGVKFMPAVNWVERGMHGDGNSVPRYHIVWGTSRELTRRMVAALRETAAAQGAGRPPCCTATA